MREGINESENQLSRQSNRIFVDKSHRDLIYGELTKPLDDEKVSPFESMKHLFMLAVFIGYRGKKRIPLTSGNRIDIFRWDQLGEEDVTLLRALALAETGDVAVLSDQVRILTIAEEYANAGIMEIQEKIDEIPGDRIKLLVSLLGACLPDDLMSAASL